MKQYDNNAQGTVLSAHPITTTYPSLLVLKSSFNPRTVRIKSNITLWVPAHLVVDLAHPLTLTIEQSSKWHKEIVAGNHRM